MVLVYTPCVTPANNNVTTIQFIILLYTVCDLSLSRNKQFILNTNCKC